MITLRVTRYEGVPPEKTVSACIDMDGGTIGRSADSTLPLPDPGKRISRLQARVSYDGHSFVIVDEGSNPGLLNGRSLPRGRGARISPGDQLVMGPYELVVEGEPSTSAGGIGLEGPATVGVVDDPLRLFGGLSSGESSQRVVGFDQAPAGRPTVDRIPPPEGQVPPPARRPQASTTPIPEDFDPFAPPRIENPLPDSGRVHSSKGASPLGIELGPQPSLDDLYHLQGGSRSEPFGPGHPLSPRSRTEPAARSDLLPDWEKPATVTSGSNLAEVNEPMDLPRMVPDRSTTAPRPTAPEAPHRDGITDPLLLFPAGLEKGRSQQQPSPASSQPETAAAKRASRPPAPPPEQTASPPPLVQSAVLLKASKAEVSPAGSAEELLAAFLEGAGVADLDRRTTTQLAFMRLVGQLLREATQGAYELLYARRTTKHELRVWQTVIAPKENNPLKFSPDPEAALRQLLLPPVRGFMTPVEAMRDAFDDLEAHQFGVIAGIRAALSTLLERFDPGELEKQLVSRSIIDSMVPLNRNARLWEVFKERYQRLRDEAEEDFNSIFGRAFVRAYEEQIERLRSKRDDEK